MSTATASRPVTAPASAPTTASAEPRFLARARELQQWVAQGKIIEAMNEFYDPNVSMQENTRPATVGLTVNIEREKAFLAQIKEWKGYSVASITASSGGGEEVTTVENVIEFVNTAGQPVRIEQVNVQRWRNGKIVSERFYYGA